VECVGIRHFRALPSQDCHVICFTFIWPGVWQLMASGNGRAYVAGDTQPAFSMMSMQNWEDGEQRQASPTPPAESAKAPFSLMALLFGGTVLLGLLGGWFFSQQREPDVPAVTMLSQTDMPEAIPTLNPALAGAVRADTRECRYPMGFISVSTPGNPAGGNVVFRTSKYQSPVFHVTEQPQRIAIPSPLPETGGIDILSADGDAKNLLVSLYPTTRMEPVNGSTSIKVFWRPRPACK
jgi:hypothetical protein